MKHRLSIIILVCLLTLLANTAAAEPIQIRFSHVVGPETPKGKAAEYFKKLVEQRSDHRVLVKIYPGAKLGNDLEAIELLRENEIQLAAPSFSKLSSFNPQLQLFDLPFLVEDVSHLHRIFDGQVGEELLASTSTRGLVALSFWDNGFKQLTANMPLAVPGDARGLRFRVMESAVLRAQFESLDAKPLGLPFPQLYRALESGEADGQENTLSNIYSQQLHKVQQHLTISNHGFLGYMVLTSKGFWDELPDDLKVILRGAIRDAAEYTRDMATEINRDALQKLEAEANLTIHRLTAAERQAWKNQLRKIYPRFHKTIGESLIRSAQQEEIR